MDAFSYLSVLLSIIIGLSITQVLQGYRGLLLNRASVALFAPSLIWSVLLIAFSTQLWWASFGLADHSDWNFATFAVILIQTVLLYMMSALVLPDFANQKPIDLAAHYWNEVVPFFAITLAMLISSVGKDWMLTGRLPSPGNLAFHIGFASIALLAIVSRRRLVHNAIAWVMVAFTGSYIALMFARLGQS